MEIRASDVGDVSERFGSIAKNLETRMNRDPAGRNQWPGAVWAQRLFLPLAGKPPLASRFKRGNQDIMDSTHLLWTRIAAGICTLMFGGMFFNLIRLRGRIGAAAGWPAVEGVVIASGVDAPAAHLSDDLNDAAAVVRYRYRVGGRQFEGDRTRIDGEPLTTRMLATRLAARYPVGATVDVHVDPAHPENAVLDPAETGTLTAQFVLTVTFGIIAMVLVAHAIAGRVLTSSNGVPLFAFLLPALAFAATIASILSFVRMRRLARAGMSWPTTSGTIKSSAVIEEWVEDRRDDDKQEIRRKIPRYQVDLRYAYRVAQRDFVGLDPNFGWTGIYGLRELAEKAAGQYRVGQAVTVYHDPQRPANSVLEPSARGGTYAPLVFGAISAVVGAVLLSFFLSVGFS
jgi:hypothetical protein